ncbi:MAG: activator of HSP90 ATPase [Sphingobacteriales bacterium 17-39-43]|uniref:SRPBCC family protein n=1 Tax=Daejeonella sp. TaxID=2805397 RepID=UPI000BC75069|nr:SRPBCC family protein [Daejeonella sp.]OYY04982.1 MAG: activator of HSP90 ATPase [Sphingobacteriia bacterium 35-40-5]OYZ30657.1 MAG: activator of HSP90 ATPase [Sphingobacteriales bacterium 16-39-50]OZA23378.1 MAG: activator of HSP90 ATPase [Sphingobacteriales bacterium 17-39-43]HQT23904.1 SRPBCC family protein [Daejeonella sp.]HQT56599.1 SRPBCC family protein [Daejeonella sp.]
MKRDKIIIQAIVSADIEKVWDYYTRPEHITKWNFASEDWQCPHASNDMRVGGKYIARMEAKDGSFGFDFEAVYDQIIVGKRFNFTMPDGREVRVTFKDADGKTEVSISFDAETENSIELQRQGWQAILDNFKKYTERN